MKSLASPETGAGVTASHRRMLARLRLAAALAILLPLAALSVAAGLMYREEFRQARDTLLAATRIAQEHALKLIDTNEMLLGRMQDLFGPGSDAEVLARGAELHARLKALASGLPQVQGLFAIGADGRMLATHLAYPPPRHLDFSDREFLSAHRAGNGPRVYVTGQLVSRVSGERFFDMSLRRTLADGSYAGTVNVSLKPEYFERFWQDIAEGSIPGLRVAVIRADGRFIARWPSSVPASGLIPQTHALMQQIATGAAQGFVETQSAFEPVNRMTSFSRLGEHPLYVLTAFNQEHVIAGWAKRIGLLALFALPLTAAVGWMAWLGYRRTRDELRAIERLQEESARRQQAELALAQSQRLETAGRLAGGIAHELNNLLMIVASHAHILRLQQKGRDALSPGLAAIDRAVGSGRRLTRQLLALSGRQLQSPERVSLQLVLPAAVPLLRPALPAGVELVVKADPDTAPILIDVEELELALINLALNARDAMAGRGRLAIQARNASTAEAGALEGGAVVIEVTDSGSGIDPAIMSRVREPLFTTKPAGFGSGLGLTQVQALCASGNGRLDIDSAPGAGTTVRLVFPRAAAQPGGALAAQAPSSDAPLNREVLFVEDDDAVAQATVAVLRTLGCTVEHASDASAALRALEAKRFDVVLTDIDMPGELDGIALATRLAQRQPPVPVVLISGQEARLEEAKAKRLPALAKPCSAALLREALSRATAIRAAA